MFVSSLRSYLRNGYIGDVKEMESGLWIGAKVAVEVRALRQKVGVHKTGCKAEAGEGRRRREVIKAYRAETHVQKTIVHANR